MEYVEPGSLKKPGPIGRSLRLLLGLLCLFALWEISRIASLLIADPVHLLPNLSLMLLPVLCIFNYVVNIGFSGEWKHFPIIIVLVVLGLFALGGFLVTGNASTALLGVAMLSWLVYFYAHLGTSFLLAALLATPGCEMRSIPQLLGKITHRKIQQHRCPVSLISGIDDWEARHTGSND